MSYSGRSLRFYGSSRRSSNSNFRSSRFKKPASRINKEKYIYTPEQKVETESTKKLFSEFKDYNLESLLKKNILDKGYTHTTEVQHAAIPLILEGKDILGISSTGSGKTGAFLIPLINKLLKNNNQKLLVIAPTRELAQQIEKEAISLIKGSNVYVASIIGGESIYKQQMQLRRNPRIVIGTPGRLTDMFERRQLNLREFNNLVLDEVDRMLDMGFVNDIRNIYKNLSPQKQCLFFSATIDSNVEKIIYSMAPDYTSLKFSSNTSAKSVKQGIVMYENTIEKIEKLHELLISEKVQKTIVFVETKRYVNTVERELRDRGFKVGSLHGDKTQARRKLVVNQYKENRFNILVATNVAARGLDIDDISHIINFDEPQTYEEYIHRIGRTGRNGKTGSAYTFVKASR